MSVDLTTARHACNARSRAWIAYGVPARVWCWIQRGTHPWGESYEFFRVELYCLTCRTAWTQRFNLDTIPPNFVRAVEESTARQVCSHLVVLHGPTPPEVVAITELELLAG
jgi:hypothetical protein